MSRRRYLSILAILISSFALYAVGRFVWQSINGPPFILTIRSVDESAIVQFTQRDSRDGDTLVSPMFTVPVRVEQGSTVELTSRTMQLPAGEIEFADTTITPGRFTIRFGDKVLDVMEARIIEDGVDRGWQPQP